MAVCQGWREWPLRDKLLVRRRQAGWGWGVLAWAAALGDSHFWLLLQFDVDHWAHVVKQHRWWGCRFHFTILCNAIWLQSQQLTFFSGNEKALVTSSPDILPKSKETLAEIRITVKRILSSLLFSGVLSIPGNAAATRRNSYKTKWEQLNPFYLTTTAYKAKCCHIGLHDKDTLSVTVNIIYLFWKSNTEAVSK